MKITEMSDKELEKEYLSMDETINKIRCYGTRDLMYYYTLEKEIDRRGGTIEKNVKVKL